MLASRYLTWKHWTLILLPVMAVSLHMVIHSPLKQLGLDAMVYIALPGKFESCKLRRADGPSVQSEALHN